VKTAEMSDTAETSKETPVAKLLKMLKVTAGCRFIASKRLAYHDKKLTRVTAFASAYVIGLTVMPYFMKLPTETTDLYNIVTVALSIIILVSSLLQYSNGDIVNAEQHHRSGLEINELYRLLLLKVDTVTPEELRDFTGRYNAVLQKYSINHDDIDF
jgi:SMODS and SLOG-associating 2TM effector domain family 5